MSAITLANPVVPPAYCAVSDSAAVLTFSCCPLLKKIFTAFCNGLQRLMDYIRSVLGYPPRVLTAEYRENRIRHGAENISARLAKELAYAQQQMQAEPAKAFRYRHAPANFPTHEEHVGNYRVGVCHFQGRRANMEDEHLATAFSVNINGTIYPVTLFGIFDGHGCNAAARYIKKHFAQKLNQALVEFNPRGLHDEGVWNALKMTCVRLHRDYCIRYRSNRPDPRFDISFHAGTTAAVAMILNGKLWTANVGDSGIALDRGPNHSPLRLTWDQKPEDPRIQPGIEHRGGQVIWNGVYRINGDLGCGRSIGDNRLEGANSARPKITAVPLSEIPPHSTLYIYCDGLSDVTSTYQLCQARHPGLSPAQHTGNCVYSAWAAGSQDNISLLTIPIS
ncbi:MAG TPA: PP2C family serine/threonine-protein phosphatase [Rhabdochlamydiaceae bacterium]|jgi:serine/threonine protein phosphatase PrpC